MREQPEIRDNVGCERGRSRGEGGGERGRREPQPTIGRLQILFLSTVPSFAYLAVEEGLECRVDEAVALQQLLVLLVCLLIRSLTAVMTAALQEQTSQQLKGEGYKRAYFFFCVVFAVRSVSEALTDAFRAEGKDAEE